MGWVGADGCATALSRHWLGRARTAPPATWGGGTAERHARPVACQRYIVPVLRYVVLRYVVLRCIDLHRLS